MTFKIKLKNILTLSSLVVLFISLSASAFDKHKPLKTVDYVDLDRYLGKWYEIARFDQKFQKGCTATTATYSRSKNGDINVLNECRINFPDGRLKSAKGRAWSTNSPMNSKLKVQFFLRWLKIPFFAGDYWILDLDDDYQSVLIGDQSRKYLWILARNKKLAPERYKELVNKAESLGFDSKKLLKTWHKN